MGPDVRRFDRLDELSRVAADACADVMRGAIAARGRCAIALAGGNTPRLMYQMLATIDRIDWARVHVFWGDERFVPAGDTRSNYRMARETLLDHVPCPPDQIHPMPTTMLNPDEAATAYERALRQFFPSGAPGFDLAVLGLGADGHTASLFPYSPALHESERLVVPVRALVEPPLRLTLTLPPLVTARRIFVMTAGSDKEAALQHVLATGADVDQYPAAALLAAHGRLTWWVARMG